MRDSHPLVKFQNHNREHQHQQRSQGYKSDRQSSNIQYNHRYEFDDCEGDDVVENGADCCENEDSEQREDCEADSAAFAANQNRSDVDQE